jgi:hypothetical protein
MGIVTTTFSCTQPWQRSAQIVVFYVHHHHGCVRGGKGAVDQDFEWCDVRRGRRDVAGVVELVAADC